MKDSKQLKKELDAVRSMIMISIDELLIKNNDELLLDDDRGNLITNEIDMQTSETVMRVFRKPDHKGVNRIMAGVGVYDEDCEVPIENYGTDFLINILKATEEADSRNQDL